jgi:hypothetical protein
VFALLWTFIDHQYGQLELNCLLLIFLPRFTDLKEVLAFSFIFRLWCQDLSRFPLKRTFKNQVILRTDSQLLIQMALQSQPS